MSSALSPLTSHPTGHIKLPALWGRRGPFLAPLSLGPSLEQENTNVEEEGNTKTREDCDHDNQDGILSWMCLHFGHPVR
jgi:hypothetical protein